MKKFAGMVAALVLFAPAATFAGKDSMNKMEHMEHAGGVAHEEVVDGVKATFKVMNMAEHLKAMKIQMPKGMKETHHVAVEFRDARSDHPLTEGDVRTRVQAPDKSEQVKDLMAMEGHFGADFVLSQKGRYGVMSKFKLKDGKVRQVRFWYDVK